MHRPHKNSVTFKGMKVDLSALHALCEANYVRLLRLFPDYENANQQQICVGNASIDMRVLERCRYTTFFHLHQRKGESRWLGHLQVELRAYHDARMLEVGMFQSHRQVEVRYDYPNRHMFAQDEKFQQNFFLAEWLEYCLNNGRSSLDVAAQLTPS